MKGYVQVITVILGVFAVMALLLVLVATDIQFDTTLVSSQQEELNSYQSKLYMHTVTQNRTLTDKAGKYILTGSPETENATRKGLEKIIGENGSRQEYRVSIRKTTGSPGENNLTFSNGNPLNLAYTRVLVPSAKTELYELTLGSKVQ